MRLPQFIFWSYESSDSEPHTSYQDVWLGAPVMRDPPTSWNEVNEENTHSIQVVSQVIAAAAADDDDDDDDDDIYIYTYIYIYIYIYTDSMMFYNLRRCIPRSFLLLIPEMPTPPMVSSHFLFATLDRMHHLCREKTFQNAWNVP